MEENCVKRMQLLSQMHKIIADSLKKQGSHFDLANAFLDGIAQLVSS
jgi:hypothetical protein